MEFLCSTALESIEHGGNMRNRYSGKKLLSCVAFISVFALASSPAIAKEHKILCGITAPDECLIIIELPW